MKKLAPAPDATDASNVNISGAAQVRCSMAEGYIVILADENPELHLLCNSTLPLRGEVW